MVLQVQLANRAGAWRDAKVSDLDCGRVSSDLIGVYEAPTHWHPGIVRKPVPMPVCKPPKSP